METRKREREENRNVRGWGWYRAVKQKIQRYGREVGGKRKVLGGRGIRMLLKIYFRVALMSYFWGAQGNNTNLSKSEGRK